MNAARASPSDFNLIPNYPGSKYTRIYTRSPRTPAQFVTVGYLQECNLSHGEKSFEKWSHNVRVVPHELDVLRLASFFGMVADEDGVRLPFIDAMLTYASKASSVEDGEFDYAAP